MNKQKLFIMALFATKPDLEFMDVIEDGDGRVRYSIQHRDGMHLSSPIGITPYAEIASSSEEAKQMGMERALEFWPPAEGWVAHFVAVSSRSLEETLREAFGPLYGIEPEGMEGESASGRESARTESNGEWPDLLVADDSKLM